MKQKNRAFIFIFFKTLREGVEAYKVTFEVQRELMAIIMLHSNKREAAT